MQTPTLAWYVKEYCIENTFRSLLVSTFTGFPASLFKLAYLHLKYIFKVHVHKKKNGKKMEWQNYIYTINTVIGTCEPWKKFILNPLFGFNLKFLYFILIRLYKHVVWLSNDLFCQFLRQFFWVILRIQNIWF